MADLAEDVTFEDAVLSKIPRQCDEPFLNQEGIKDDAKEEVVKETSNTACLFSWEFSFCRDRWKRFHKETCPTNEEASLTSNLSSQGRFGSWKRNCGVPWRRSRERRGEAPGPYQRPFCRTPYKLRDSLNQPNDWRGSLLLQNQKLLCPTSSLIKKSVLNEPVDPGETESKQLNDQSIVGSSGKVGKTSL